MLQLTGTAACLLMMFTSSGGHWAVLQSFAYTRMLFEFAQQDSLCTAVKKAFDERYACPLCPKIRDGFNKEQKLPSTVNEVQQPEFLVQSNGIIFFSPMIVAYVVSVSSRHIDFSTPPPTPPPRVA